MNRKHFAVYTWLVQVLCLIAMSILVQGALSERIANKPAALVLGLALFGLIVYMHKLRKL
jgi:hypothetical protein